MNVVGQHTKALVDSGYTPASEKMSHLQRLANERGTSVEALHAGKGEVRKMSYAEQVKSGVINISAGKGMSQGLSQAA